MGIISSLLFIQNDSGRGHIFARIHGRMNILLEDFRLNYEPARIFAKAESIFERLTECETAPLLFLDKEIEQTVRERSANYACLVMLMLMEIIRTEPMPAFLLPRSRYRTYLRGKFSFFNKEDILAKWDELKEAEASATRRAPRPAAIPATSTPAAIPATSTPAAIPATPPQAHKTPASAQDPRKQGCSRHGGTEGGDTACRPCGRASEMQSDGLRELHHIRRICRRLPTAEADAAELRL